MCQHTLSNEEDTGSREREARILTKPGEGNCVGAGQLEKRAWLLLAPQLPTPLSFPSFRYLCTEQLDFFPSYIRVICFICSQLKENKEYVLFSSYVLKPL